MNDDTLDHDARRANDAMAHDVAHLFHLADLHADAPCARDLFDGASGEDAQFSIEAAWRNTRGTLKHDTGSVVEAGLVADPKSSHPANSASEARWIPQPCSRAPIRMDRAPRASA